MRAWLKQPGEPGHTVIVIDELVLFQQIVGGYVEAVQLADDLVILCDEEGRLKGKAYNCSIGGYDFVGTILAVGVDGCKFAGISDEALELLDEVVDV